MVSTRKSEVLVARRYLARGFIDAAMRLLVRNATHADASDWMALVERLMERGRIVDVAHICEIGSVPLPRARLLALGDSYLRRRDVDGAKCLYELAGAERERWARLVDVLSGLPDRERLAIHLTERHLLDEPMPELRLAAAQ